MLFIFIFEITGLVKTRLSEYIKVEFKELYKCSALQKVGDIARGHIV